MIERKITEVEPDYNFVRSSLVMGGLWSTFPNPLFFKSTNTAWNILLLSGNVLESDISIFIESFKNLFNP